MTFPTLTWTNTTDRTIATAGANTSIAELLVGIKAAIDNDSQKWMTSDYSAPNGTLEVKRKGSPTGEQATVRILFMGGQTPHANALTIPSPTANTTTLYVGMSVDANTTGPAASYAAGAPYATKYIKAAAICTSSSLALSQNPKVMLIENDDALVVILHDSANCAHAINGYLLEDVANNVLHWMSFTSNTHYTNMTNDTTYNSAGGASPLDVPFLSGAFHGRYWNSISGILRSTERLNGLTTGLSGTTNALFGASGACACLMPVMMGDHANAAVSSTQFFGFLRQIRLGPMMTNASTMRNSLGTVQAIHGCVAVGLTGYGVWFDQVA